MKKSQKKLAKVVGVASVFGLSVLFSTGMTSPIQAKAQEIGSPTQNVIVVYKNTNGKQAVLNQSKKVDEQFKSVPAVSATMSQQGINQLESNPNIAYVEPDVKLKISDSLPLKPVKISSTSTTSTASSATAEESQWDLQATKAPTAWSEGITGKNVKVAVIDTGVSSHPDLTIAGGVSTVDYTTSYADDNGHGTNVAGFIGAKHDGKVMVGVSPDVSLYSVKSLGSDGTGNLSDILEGLDWAISNHMNIVNMSLGTSYDSQALHDMIDKAYNNGVLVVSASGNSGNSSGTGDNVTYPAKYDHVVSVSAVDNNFNRAYFSSTGSKVDLSAGGVNVLSTYLNGQYAYGSGTSQASPHVAGLLALLKQKYPTKTIDDLVNILKNTAKDLGVQGKDSFYGYGLAQYSTVQLPPNMTQAQYNQLLNLAKTYTNYAEKYKTSSYINLAQQYINQLPDGADKSDLQARLDAVKKAIADAQLATAKQLVSNAEKYKTQYYVEIAQKAINVLPDSQDKTDLQARLDAVKQAIADAQLKANLDKAKLLVSFAEKYKTQYNVDNAQKAINVLPASPDKTDLQVRLDAVKQAMADAQLKANLDKANQYVSYAEKYKSTYYINLAQKYIDVLPDCQQKTDLQNRLNAVKSSLPTTSTSSLSHR